MVRARPHSCGGAALEGGAYLNPRAGGFRRAAAPPGPSLCFSRFGPRSPRRPLLCFVRRRPGGWARPGCGFGLACFARWGPGVPASGAVLAFGPFPAPFSSRPPPGFSSGPFPGRWGGPAALVAMGFPPTSLPSLSAPPGLRGKREAYGLGLRPVPSELPSRVFPWPVRQPCRAPPAARVRVCAPGAHLGQGVGLTFGPFCGTLSVRSLSCSFGGLFECVSP